MDGTTTTAMDVILDAAGSVIEFSGTCLNAMIENPVYAFIFAAGFVGIGLGLVRKLKRSAH